MKKYLLLTACLLCLEQYAFCAEKDKLSLTLSFLSETWGLSTLAIFLASIFTGIAALLTATWKVFSWVNQSVETKLDKIDNKIDKRSEKIEKKLDETRREIVENFVRQFKHASQIEAVERNATAQKITSDVSLKISEVLDDKLPKTQLAQQIKMNIEHIKSTQEDIGTNVIRLSKIIKDPNSVSWDEIEQTNSSIESKTKFPTAS